MCSSQRHIFCWLIRLVKRMEDFGVSTFVVSILGRINSSGIAQMISSTILRQCHACHLDLRNEGIQLTASYKSAWENLETLFLITGHKWVLRIEFGRESGKEAQIELRLGLAIYDQKPKIRVASMRQFVSLLDKRNQKVGSPELV